MFRYCHLFLIDFSQRSIYAYLQNMPNGIVREYATLGGHDLAFLISLSKELNALKKNKKISTLLLLTLHAVANEKE